jgi:hypothetical protein
MPFSVKAYHADHLLTVTNETAKEAFARARSSGMSSKGSPT